MFAAMIVNADLITNKWQIAFFFSLHYLFYRSVSWYDTSRSSLLATMLMSTERFNKCCSALP